MVRAWIDGDAITIVCGIHLLLAVFVWPVAIEGAITGESMKMHPHHPCLTLEPVFSLNFVAATVV